jgi:hypothetical protein
MLLPMVESKYVIDSLVLCNSILSHRIGKEIMVHEHNGSGSHSTMTLLHLMQNMGKCH